MTSHGFRVRRRGSATPLPLPASGGFIGKSPSLLGVWCPTAQSYEVELPSATRLLLPLPAQPRQLLDRRSPRTPAPRTDERRAGRASAWILHAAARRQ